MIGFFIAIAVIIVLVAVIVRHDGRQRGLSSWSDGRKPENARMDNQTRADKWRPPNPRSVFNVGQDAPNESPGMARAIARRPRR